MEHFCVTFRIDSEGPFFNDLTVNALVGIDFEALSYSAIYN